MCCILRKYRLFKLCTKIGFNPKKNNHIYMYSLNLNDMEINNICFTCWLKDDSIYYEWVNYIENENNIICYFKCLLSDKHRAHVIKISALTQWMTALWRFVSMEYNKFKITTLLFWHFGARYLALVKNQQWQTADQKFTTNPKRIMLWVITILKICWSLPIMWVDDTQFAV